MGRWWGRGVRGRRRVGRLRRWCSSRSRARVRGGCRGWRRLRVVWPSRMFVVVLWGFVTVILLFWWGFMFIIVVVVVVVVLSEFRVLGVDPSGSSEVGVILE